AAQTESTTTATTGPTAVAPATQPNAEPLGPTARGEAVEPAVANGAPTASAPESAPNKALAEPAAPAAVASANAMTPDAGSHPLGQKGNEPAQLTVRCQPACEMIFVDNKKVEASVPVSVTPGTHLVAAGRTGYPARTERVTLAPGEKHVTTMSLI